MANFGQLILTSKGITAQYNAQSGTPLKFKRIAMGSGEYSGNISSLTKLVNENVSVDITNGYMQNNAYIVEGFFSNENLQTGFAWREIGVFIEDTSGNEILYCYANAGDTYDYIPATEDERYTKYIRIATAIGNASNVSIVENESFTYVDTITFNNAISELRTAVDAHSPSKVEEGTAIFIDDSANLPFASIKVYGKSEQAISNGYQLIPQPYNDTTIEASGITFTPNEDGSVTVKGTATANSYFTMDGGFASAEISIPEWLVEGETYTVSGGTSDIGILPFFYTKDGQTVSYGAYAAGNTFVMPSGYDYYGIFIQVPSGKTVNTTIYPMLNKGNKSLSYEPYTGGVPGPNPDYPLEINSIGDSGKIDVSVATKNLFDKNVYTFIDGTTIDNETGELKDTTANGWRTFEELITIKENTDYILSGYIVPTSWTITVGFYNSNKEYLTYTKVTNHNGVNSFKFTTPENAAYLRFNAHLDTLDINTIQLEKGSSVTDYEVGNTQTLTLSTPNGLPGIPVSKDGNYTDENGQQWICDEIDLSRGVYIQRVKNVTFDGTDATNLHYVTTYGTALRFDYKYGGVKPNSKIMANMLPRIIISTPDIEGIGVHSKEDNIQFQILASRLESADVKGLIGYFATNPLQVTYILETPIETALTDAEIEVYKALTTNKPNTTILNDGVAHMKVEYITQQYQGSLGMLVDRIKYLEAMIGNINTLLDDVNGEVV